MVPGSLLLFTLVVRDPKSLRAGDLARAIVRDVEDGHGGGTDTHGGGNVPLDRRCTAVLERVAPHLQVGDLPHGDETNV